MKKTRFLLKAALSVALFIPPWGGLCEWLTPQAKAQAPAWALGNKQVDVLGQQAPFDVNALPQPVGADTYTGAAAQVSQFALTDGEGQLAGFGIDGNIYDKEGYLMADAYDPGGCDQCVEPGIMEMLSIPVPGKCGVFYLLSCSPPTNVPGEER